MKYTFHIQCKFTVWTTLRNADCPWYQGKNGRKVLQHARNKQVRFMFSVFNHASWLLTYLDQTREAFTESSFPSYFLHSFPS
jgi:hypothetical protein